MRKLNSLSLKLLNPIFEFDFQKGRKVCIQQLLCLAMIGSFAFINEVKANLICPIMQSHYTTDPGQCTAYVTIPQPTTDDPIWLLNIENDYNSNATASDFYPVGTTRVTFTGYFNDGTTKQCYVDVVVQDRERPAIVCPDYDFDECPPTDLFATLASFEAAGGVVSDNCELDESSYRVAVDTTILTAPCERRITWTFRILDASGNVSSICSLQSVFDDNDPPVVTDVPTFEDIDCGDDLPALDANAITVEDNCDGDVMITTMIEPEIEFACADTEIRYTWLVEDACGNVTEVSAMFNILASVDPPMIVGTPDPLDDIDCNDPMPGVESFTASHCTTASVEFEVDVTPDVCAGYPVIYRWTPIDACDNEGTPVEVSFNVNPDSEGPIIDEPEQIASIKCNEGFPIQQILTAYDDCIADAEAPVFDLSCDPIVLCTGDDPMEAEIFLRQSVRDNCSQDQNIIFSYEIDTNMDGVIDIVDSGIGSVIVYEDTFPIGIHSIMYSFTDASGNNVSCTQLFEIRLCATAPIANCRSSASVSLNFIDLDGDGINDSYGVFVFADLLDLGSNDPSGGPVTLSLSPDPADQSIYWDCNNVGWNQLVVWITNALGEQTYCKVDVLVLDPQGSCIGFNNSSRPNNPFACRGPVDVVASVDPYTEDVCAGYTVVYRWEAEDPCGNLTEVTRSFEVLPSKPEITAPEDALYEIGVLDVCELEVTLEPAVMGIALCSPIVSITTNYPGGNLPTNGGTVTLDAGINEIEYEAIDECGNVCVVTSLVSILRPCAIGCRDQVNVSIGPECNALIIPSMIGIDIPYGCEYYYEVEVKDEHGDIIPNDMVDESHVGQNVTVSVIDPFCETSCWGMARIENKLLSELECDCPVGGVTGLGESEDDYADNCLLKCGQKDIIQSGIEREYASLYCQFLPFSVPFDNCGNSQNISFSDIWSENGCGQWKLHRTYALYQNVRNEITGVVNSQIVDNCTYEYFVTSYSVNDTMGICRENDIPVLDDVDESFENKIFLPIKTIELECGDDNYTPEELESSYDVKSTKDYANTTAVEEYNEGIPYAYPYYYTKGEDCIYHAKRIDQLLCNLEVSYQDTEIKHCGIECGNIIKIFRQWRLWDWCTQEETTWSQIIKQVDHEGPTIVVEDITIGTDPWTCEGSALIPHPKSIRDNCDTNLSYEVVTEDGFKITGNATAGYYVEGIPETYDEEFYTLYYVSEDCCGNYSTVPFKVFAYDNRDPIPICEQYKVVALPPSGEVKVGAFVFDTGSSDCNLANYHVRKMTNNCECHIPYFDIMDYLGSYQNSNGNTHYYYLSQHKKSGLFAYNNAIAMGGYLASYEDDGEADWVTDKVEQALSGEDYYVYDNFINSPDRHKYVLEVEDKCGWSDHVHFCCEDVGQGEIMVELRVTDYFGNYNTCMARVEVQDKVIPELVCPKDYTIYCEDNHNLTDLSVEFGSASAAHNCSEFDITETVEEDIDNCGEGIIIRTFEIAHASGTETCRQKIKVLRDSEYNFDNVIWPENFVSENVCDITGLTPDVLEPPYDIPIYRGYINCELIGDNYEDTFFESGFGTDACAKIIRKWTLINWCDRDENGDFGMVTHEQEIKTSNSMPPTISGMCEDIFICVEKLDCTPDSLVLSNTGFDDCTPEHQLRWEYTIDLNSDGTTDIVGSGNSFKRLYHFGKHIIHWKLIDNCGNEVGCSQNFELRNCKAPTPVCINGLAIDLIPMDLLDENGDPGSDGVPDNEMSEVWASDFDASSAGVCGNDITFSFSQDTTDKVIVFDCDDIGNYVIQLWVTDVNTGAQDFCETFIDVQDNNDVEICEGISSATVASITGKVFTENNDLINNVMVDLSGDNSLMKMTDVAGTYAFPNMPLGGAYILDPAKDIEHLNGVSTLDIVLIQRHILGIEGLDSPYKVISADVNNDENVSSIDLIELRKLILGIYEEFPDNESWQFVYSDFEFIDPMMPWTSNPLYAYDINTFAQSMNIDFIGMKIGDVNNSVSLDLTNNLATSRSTKNLNISYKSESGLSEDNHEIHFYAADFEDISGLQFSLDYNPMELQILNVRSGALNLDQSNYFYENEKGIFNLSWHTLNADEIDVNSDEILFSLIISDQNLTNSNYYFKISEKSIRAEAYQNDDILQIDLHFEQDQSTDFVLYQNKPNPWREYTTVSFYIPVAGDVVMNLYDHTGQLLVQKINLFEKGSNELIVNNTELNGAGIIICELIYQDQIISNKMLLLD